MDARRKARRSDIEGFKLARVIEQLPTNVPVGLLGFSYGSRLTGSTLHFLGGGTLAGLPRVASQDGSTCSNSRSVRAVSGRRTRLRLGLLAQGMNWQCFAAADCILVLRNQHDPVLLAYRHLEEFAGTPAMGKVGPSPTSCAEPLVVWNVSADIRVSHDWRHYVGNPQIFAPHRFDSALPQPVRSQGSRHPNHRNPARPRSGKCPAATSRRTVTTSGIAVRPIGCGPHSRKTAQQPTIGNRASRPGKSQLLRSRTLRFLGRPCTLAYSRGGACVPSQALREPSQTSRRSQLGANRHARKGVSVG